MKIIDQLTATTNEPVSPFDNDALQQLADTAIGRRVMVDFDTDKTVGRVTAAKVTDKGLLVSATIDINAAGKYLVPGFIRDGFRCMGFGVVDKPMDKTVPMICEE